MAREQFDRAYRLLTPLDVTDPPRFGQQSETAVDAVVAGITYFFQTSAMPPLRIDEIPTVRKYMRRSSPTLDYATQVQVLRDNPGIFENLPHIVVAVSSLDEIPISIGPPVMSTVQRPPRITASLAGPYALVDGSVLALRTWPSLRRRVGQGEVVSHLVFRADRFPAIGAVTAAQLAAEINALGLYVRAQPTTVGLGQGVEIRTGGPRGTGTPNFIEVHPDTTAEVRAALGLGNLNGTGDAITAAALVGSAYLQTLTDAAATFPTSVVGRRVLIAGSTDPYSNDGRFAIVARPTAQSIQYQSTVAGVADPSFAGTYFIGEYDDQDNPLRPPVHRMAMRDRVTLNIEVVAEDQNVRTELADLLQSYFTFFAGRDYFAYLGRAATYVNQTAALDAEAYQMIMSKPVHRSGRVEIARPSGDQQNKVYVETLTVTFVLESYMDRPVLTPDTNENWMSRSDDFDPLPDGTLATPD